MMVRDGAAGAGSGGRVPPSVIGISRRERRDAARGRASIEFGADADAALDILELLELAWHDCYGDPTPPADVVEDVWALADGEPRPARVGRSARGHRLARPAPRGGRGAVPADGACLTARPGAALLTGQPGLRAG